MFRLAKGLKTDSKEVVMVNWCNEKERGKVWKDYMERIINEDNDWDRNAEGDAVGGAVVCVSREEVLQALNEIRKL